MKIEDTKALWLSFKDAFARAFDEKTSAALVNAWGENPTKTSFYEKILMPAIGDLLGLDYQIERLRCDYTFLNKDRIPLIAVESENSHPTASREIETLCSLAAPLKVLMLSCAWQASEKAIFLPLWTDIIRKHHAIVSVDCMYAIIVGEWHGEAARQVEYSFTRIDSKGNPFEEGFLQIRTDRK